jgi:CRISPR-associated endoribonuclease Cas6
LERETSLPLNHQHFLTAAVYDFLDRADADYARFLHDDGYAANEDDADKRRFKLFCFSTIRAQKRRIVRDQLILTGNEAQWFVASPLEKFLSEFASGLLGLGVLRVGRVTFPIKNVETLPAPQFSSPQALTCLTPIVAGVMAQHNGKPATKYLRPGDEEFPERLRANLLRKYSALHGHAPENSEFTVEWDENYLSRHKSTKLIDYKGVLLPGAFCPFTVSGSRELIEFAYNAGLGEKNAGGFGMIEMMK